MATTLRLAWREGVTAEASGDGDFVVAGPAARVTLNQPSGATVAALRRLAPPGDDEEALAGTALDEAGALGLSRWYFTLQRLAARGLLARSVHAGGARLATLVPLGQGFRFGPPPVAPDAPVVLCRFAYARRHGGGLVLESPRSPARVLLDDPRAAALVAALATPGSVADLEARTAGLPDGSAAAMVGLLASAGMLQGPGPDDEPPGLRAWEFHDLLFHARSRKGRSDAPFGATYRPELGIDPPPAVRPDDPGELETVDLFRPDLARLQAEDPPLARVVEARRSLREYGDRPLTARQLGEFLHRVARVREYRSAEVDTPRGPRVVELAPRPFPSGGGLYELEFYLAVNLCQGLSPGLYRYDGLGHRLARLRGPTAEVGHLVRDAAASAGIPEGHVQVVVILAARFRRLAWKYASIAYALTLKHVGVVYQTMYLAATAMDLAPCALGGGDSDSFARAAGVDYYDETSVGEFLLGSRGPAVD